jgi:hypothetical protein
VKIPLPHCDALTSEPARHRRRRSLVLASVGIAALPLAWRGPSCGHDFDFHLESWLEVVRQWHQAFSGALYPHWVASANYGAGEPRFVFYPPLSWMLGALLGLILPWTWTPLAFTLLALLAMAASFFRMAREWISDDNAALAACLYVINPYVLFVAYERTAYGELLAGAWLPLLVLYALRRTPALPQLALTIAAIWLTNAPAAVMGCYAMALLVLWTAIAERRWMLLTRAVGATALGLGMAAFYLIPAIYEQRWVEIARAIGSGMRVEDSFLFGHTGEPFHDQVLHTASWIAVVLLIATAVAAMLSRRYEEAPSPTRSSATLRDGMIALAAVIACLLLPFSDAVWRYAPELKFLQFPWRWLLVLGMIASLLAGFCLRREARTQRHIWLRAGVILLLACVMSGLACISFWQPCDDEDNVHAQLATFHAGGFEGTDEYTSAPADNGDIQQGLPPLRVLREAAGDEADSSVAENPAWQASTSNLQPSQIHIERWNVEHMTANVDSSAPAFAVLRLMDYPAWRVLVNGQTISSRPRRDDGLMTIPIPAGHAQIDVRYTATADVWAGRLVSLVCILFFLICFRKQVGWGPRQQVSCSECKPKFM